MKIILFIFSFVAVINLHAQKRYPLQVQLLGDYTITLQMVSEENRLPDYVLEFFNKKTQETSSVIIDSIHHVPCGGLSLQFINEKLGFIYETGGCYAIYHWLYRTEDGGITWKKMIGNVDSEISNIRDKDFYMFNEKSGVLLLQLKNGQLTWMITDDGGETWTTQTATFTNKAAEPNYIIHTSFSEKGFVTLMMCPRDMYNTNEYQREITTVISMDSGKTFYQVQVKN